jgi:hypothetical protein
MFAAAQLITKKRISLAAHNKWLSLRFLQCFFQMRNTTQSGDRHQ